jgi:hypothetical protein
MNLFDWSAGDCAAVLAMFFVVAVREGWRYRRHPGDRRRRR